MLQVYIESKITLPCIHVLPGDRLGVFFEEVPTAVAYSFHPQPSEPMVFARPNNKTEFSLNDIAFFDSLMFPYDFSVIAHIDTMLSEYNDLPANGNTMGINCSKGLLIPPYIPPVLSRTTPMPVLSRTTPIPTFVDASAMGPQGLEGEREDAAEDAAGPEVSTGSQGAKESTGDEQGEPGPLDAVVQMFGNDSLPAESVNNSPLANITQNAMFGVGVAGVLALNIVGICAVVAYMVNKNRKAKRQEDGTDPEEHHHEGVKNHKLNLQGNITTYLEKHPQTGFKDLKPKLQENIPTPEHLHESANKYLSGITSPQEKMSSQSFNPPEKMNSHTHNPTERMSSSIPKSLERMGSHMSSPLEKINSYTPAPLEQISSYTPSPPETLSSHIPNPLEGMGSNNPGPLETMSNYTPIPLERKSSHIPIPLERKRSHIPSFLESSNLTSIPHDQGSNGRDIASMGAAYSGNQGILCFSTGNSLIQPPEGPYPVGSPHNYLAQASALSNVHRSISQRSNYQLMSTRQSRLESVKIGTENPGLLGNHSPDQSDSSPEGSEVILFSTQHKGTLHSHNPKRLVRTMWE